MKKLLSEIASSKTLSTIGMTLFAIILERIFAPIIDIFTSNTKLLGLSIIRSFSDSYYQIIAHGGTGQSEVAFTFFVFIILLICLSYLVVFKRNTFQPRESILLTSAIRTLFAATYLFLCILIASYSMASNKSVTMLTNIEIVAPYISDHDYKQLKSDFYLIETREDYIALQSRIESIARKKLTQLRE